MSPSFISEGPIWYICFLFSITCHEAAHAWAAHLGGDDTAYHEGQVSLNPIPHIQREPFGTVFVPLITYMLNGWMVGWASAPYNPYWQVRYPHRSALMALAGPLANFIIVLLTGLIIKIGFSMGIFEPSFAPRFTQIISSTGADPQTGITLLLSILFCLNLVLAVFNLIPLPPLDGATIIGLLMSEENALKIYEVTRNPGFQLIGLFIAWKVFDNLFLPVFIMALRLLYM